MVTTRKRSYPTPPSTVRRVRRRYSSSSGSSAMRSLARRSSTSSSSSSSSYLAARRGLGRLAGGTLGYIAGNVPGAAIGQYAGGLMADYTAPTVSQTKMGAIRYYGKSYKGKWKKKSISKMEANGVNTTFAYTGSQSSASAAGSLPWVALGTTTAPAALLIFGFCQGIVKTLVKKTGVNVVSMAETVQGTVTGDILRLKYQAETGEAQGTADVLTSGGAWSIQTGATGLQTWLSTNATPGLQLLELQYIPNSSQMDLVSVDLQSSFTQCKIDVEMLLQNVTVPSAATDEDTVDDVDAVTLVGKGFIGKGSGTYISRALGASSTTAEEGFWPASSGLIARTNATNQPNASIPNPEQLYNCKASRKLKIEPGGSYKIKMGDYYKYSTNLYLQKIITILKQSATPVYYNSFKMGKYNVQCFQRDIEPNSAAPRPVTLNYSLKFEIVTNVVCYERKVTTKSYWINGVLTP